MFCAAGQKLKDDMAVASTRFSDSAPVDAKRRSIGNRLEIEKLQLAHQETLRAFRQHVEDCPICSQHR